MLSDDDGADGSAADSSGGKAVRLKPRSDSDAVPAPASAHVAAPDSAAPDSDLHVAAPDSAAPDSAESNSAACKLGSPDPVMFLGLFSCCCGTVRFEHEIL